MAEPPGRQPGGPGPTVAPASPGRRRCIRCRIAQDSRRGRAEFGLRLLDWWGVRERETLTLAADESGRWPVDCRMDVSLAGRVLQTPMWRVDEVLGSRA